MTNSVQIARHSNRKENLFSKKISPQGQSELEANMSDKNTKTIDLPM
jgi:hypothetical protein